MLNEAKQVGTIYHFTTYDKSLSIILNQQMTSKEYISFTRNYDLKDAYSNDVNWGDVRITIDGNKLSNKYKIEPFLDTKNSIKRNKGENEERIIKKSINIKGMIKQIDILDDERNKKSINDIEYICKVLRIKCNIVDKFKK